MSQINDMDWFQGARRRKITNVVSLPTTAGNSVDYVRLTVTGTYTLPLITNITIGREIYIRAVGVTVTVAGNTSDLINGSATQILTNGDAITVVAVDLLTWEII